MDYATGWILAGTVILLWILCVYYFFARSPWGKGAEAAGFSMYGPFIMWRTKRGRELLENLSKYRKLWGFYGDAAIACAAAAAIVMMGLLMWQSVLVPSIASEDAPSPETMLGLPGINKFIPFGYGIFGLAIAIIVHESAHGILMRLGGIRLKSLGLLFFVVPVGAFAEQDEEDMRNGSRRGRMRVFAGGPMANLLLAFVCMAVFSSVLMPAVQPAREGVGVMNVGAGTPADGTLETTMIITSFNGTAVADYADFSDAIAITHANQTVAITVYYQGAERSFNVTLDDRGDYVGGADNEGRGYLGISGGTVSTDRFHPIAGAKNSTALVRNFLIFITLPISGGSPVEGAQMDFYTVSGPLDEGTFWLLSNAVYWVFWLNLMVGLTNVLPAVPLDGGYIYKDWLEKLFGKLGLKGGNRDEQVKLVDKIVLATSFLVLALILWPLIGPRIM
ncbi:MAG: site-2 protease family protein [Methanobacteriota archaeon]